MLFCTYNVIAHPNGSIMCQFGYLVKFHSGIADHAIVLSMFILSFIFVIVCRLFEWIKLSSVRFSKEVYEVCYVRIKE